MKTFTNAFLMHIYPLSPIISNSLQLGIMLASLHLLTLHVIGLDSAKLLRVHCTLKFIQGP